MIVCLHCGYAVPQAGLRACPRCGQLLPARAAEAAGSQYTPGDVLRETSGPRNVHPYLWGVVSAETEAVQPSSRRTLPTALLVVAALLVLALVVAALYLTGNADWLPLLRR